ncbi:MAG: 50S ribosomal protein L17 [Simkaniaceae bacterium]|nr:50S ribosomal protein L17 [Simkaniaceae bacterium]
MRHRKRGNKLGRNGSHRRCLMANMLKSLVYYGRIGTTVAKAKELRRHADRMVTLAKRGTLACRRKAVAEMMIRFNRLSSKEARAAKGGDLSAYNVDRLVMDRLFGELSSRYADRKGGYTRIVRTGNRVGDGADLCVIEYVV